MKPLFRTTLPEIWESVTAKITQPQLRQEISESRIYALCDCGDEDCGSFYFHKEIDSDDEGHEEKVAGVVIEEGLIALELYESHPYFLEIMPSALGREVRSKIQHAEQDAPSNGG
jgi:hypothetical protein